MGLRHYGMILALATCALYADESSNCNSAGQAARDASSSASPGAATDNAPSGQSMPVKCQSRCYGPHRIEIGANYTYAWIMPQGNPTTTGSLGGAQFLYEYCPPQSVYAAAAFNWRIGNTDNPSAPSRSLQDFNVQERLGYTFCLPCYRVMATFFSGFGARYLPETVASGAISVGFDYTEFYIPLGCLLEKRFNSLFAWGINFQWMPQVFPTVRIIPLSGTQWSLTYQLNNFSIELPFRITTYWHGKDSNANCCLLVISPFFELWHDGRSTASTTNGVGGPTGLVLGLPGNAYLFTGVNVNFGMDF